jgi:hypothetical protein
MRFRSEGGDHPLAPADARRQHIVALGRMAVITTSADPHGGHGHDNWIKFFTPLKPMTINSPKGYNALRNSSSPYARQDRGRPDCRHVERFADLHAAIYGGL